MKTNLKKKMLLVILISYMILQFTILPNVKVAHADAWDFMITHEVYQDLNIGNSGITMSGSFYLAYFDCNASMGILEFRSHPAMGFDYWFHIAPYNETDYELYLGEFDGSPSWYALCKYNVTQTWTFHQWVDGTPPYSDYFHVVITWNGTTIEDYTHEDGGWGDWVKVDLGIWLWIPIETPNYLVCHDDVSSSWTGDVFDTDFGSWTNQSVNHVSASPWDASNNCLRLPESTAASCDVAVSSSPEVNANFNVSSNTMAKTTYPTPQALVLEYATYTFTCLDPTKVDGSVTYAFDHWLINDTDTVSDAICTLFIHGITTLAMVYTPSSCIVNVDSSPELNVHFTVSLPTGLYEHYNTADDDFGSIADGKWKAETFTVGSSAHNITSVGLELAKYNNPTSMAVSIRTTDLSGFATSSELTSSSVDPSTFTDFPTFSWYTITLPECSLEPYTKYAITVNSSASGSDEIEWRVDSSSPAYLFGEFDESADGTAWSQVSPNTDAMFELWSDGNPITTYTTPQSLTVPIGDQTFTCLDPTVLPNPTYLWTFDHWLVNSTDSIEFGLTINLTLSADTDLSIVYVGSSLNSSTFTHAWNALNATWYLRSDTHTVDGIFAYKLLPENTRTATYDYRFDSSTKDVTYGFRVFAIDIFNQSSELTSGLPVALCTKTDNGSEMITAYWDCPAYSNMIDAVEVKVYQRFNSEGWSLRRLFVTHNDLLITLPSGTWTFHLYVEKVDGSTNSSMWHGSYDIYDSRIDLQYYRADPWNVALARLYQRNLFGWFITPWYYWLGDIFYGLILLFCIVTAYLRTGSLKPILALMWLLGGAGSVIWALIPASALHIAVILFAIANAMILFRLMYGKRS